MALIISVPGVRDFFENPGNIIEFLFRTDLALLQKKWSAKNYEKNPFYARMMGI